MPLSAKAVSASQRFFNLLSHGNDDNPLHLTAKSHDCSLHDFFTKQYPYLSSPIFTLEASSELEAACCGKLSKEKRQLICMTDRSCMPLSLLKLMSRNIMWSRFLLSKYKKLLFPTLSIIARLTIR
jgi:hypothetical protein